MNNPNTGGDIPQQYNKPIQKNECKHNFFSIRQDFERQDINSAYVIIGCCWCGQVRKIYANGLVHVIISKGTMKYEV